MTLILAEKKRGSTSSLEWVSMVAGATFSYLVLGHGLLGLLGFPIKPGVEMLLTISLCFVFLGSRIVLISGRILQRDGAIGLLWAFILVSIGFMLAGPVLLFFADDWIALATFGVGLVSYFILVLTPRFRGIYWDYKRRSQIHLVN